ncbi:hypothetical protein BC939DRAFT_472830 [Gamsiella multidivaricata]|uniref:uncharacterized protein n=1 Tax=Gamsiella multidivaricata TaxID=101098 RepID=UPI002220471B|nr:uncharacterized protein BC939DRAFT_472830 [Gamsiella multidivaricata]KAI7831726.1 hypothetical protein BC939DRAFT_472830 [Gamsiella multidivaricata]
MATRRSRSILVGPCFILLAILALFCITIPTADAALAVRIDATTTVNYRTWDPFQGKAEVYSLSGVLLMGQVQSDCTVRVDPAAAPAGQAILNAVDPRNPIVDSIIVLRYDWLDDCATFDDIFAHLESLNGQLQSLALPEVGALVMDGNAQSTEDFGSPFIQLANAKHWNKDTLLNISFIGSDNVLSLASTLATNNHALLATVAQDPGPWNRMWDSIGFKVVIRGLDIMAGIIFVYGLWVLAFIYKARQDNQHIRRYMVLIPGCIYLPLSIAFAPYKVQVPWRNAVYYVSLLFPFISLGLQMTMWGMLVYRIKRKKTNKLFAYFSYVTIFVPTISSFLDGIGWLIPSLPIIRVIGERGFMYATPLVILIQAVLIFYYATTFFKSLRGIAVSQTTRTALVRITVLNLAMISFFVLMLLSRIVSLMGLNMKSRSAYMTELFIFRFSFLFFYAACFRTLSIRQPSGSTVDSKGSSTNGKNPSKNHTHYPMDSLSNQNSSTNGVSSRHAQDSSLGEGSKPSLHFNKHLSNHASKGFTIPDPSSPGGYKTPSFGGAIPGPKSAHGYTSQQQLLRSDSSEYPDPYKFNEFGHLTHNESSPTPKELESATRESYLDAQEGEDKDSVYGSHRFPAPSGSKHVHIANGGRVVVGKERNSEGYSRFDVSDEDQGKNV